VIVDHNRYQESSEERAMEKSELKAFTTADEVREFPQGRVELLNAGGVRVGRVTFEPGWRWTTSIGPLADTPTCDVRHFFYHLLGTLGVRMDDGTQFECKPGELAILPPGHDAWVVGDEPVVVLELEGIRDPTRFGD
jgi:mannose-6-phosphate isomerase-like protein (cupin superfamily)